MLYKEFANDTKQPLLLNIFNGNKVEDLNDVLPIVKLLKKVDPTIDPITLGADVNELNSDVVDADLIFMDYFFETPAKSFKTDDNDGLDEYGKVSAKN